MYLCTCDGKTIHNNKVVALPNSFFFSSIYFFDKQRLDDVP